VTGAALRHLARRAVLRPLRGARRGIRARTGALVLALVVLGACSGPPPLAPLAPEARILAFGDSLTHGTGAARGRSYPEVLAARIGREVINAGVPGELSAAGLARLGPLLDRHAPQLLILCHGGNDLLRRLDPAHTAANLRAMIAEARRRGIEVVLLGVPRPGIFLGTAQLYLEVARTEAVPIERDALAEILGRAGLKSDAVHPNADGYRLLAERVEALLRDAGAL